MINLLDLYWVTEDLIKTQPHLAHMTIKLLLSKIEGIDSDYRSYGSVIDSELDLEWDGKLTYCYIEGNEDFYMLWVFFNFLKEANKQEIQDVLTRIREHYIKHLIDVDKEFERYLGRIRGNRLKKILDIANAEQSSAIVIANSVDAYHYINSDNRRMQDKYVEYCKESRTEPIEICGKDINEILDSDYEYDVVVVYPETITEEEFNLLKSIKYKKILNIYNNKFIDLEEVLHDSTLPFDVTL